jgi:predicted amidohydrolase
MNVGYIQFAPEFGNIKKNVETVRGMLHDTTADLIVLPELFNTGYYLTDFKELPDLAERIPDGYTVKQLESAAREWRMHIVAGILEEDNGNYYNSAVLIGETGYIDHYRKIHLFDEEKIYFTPGNIPLKVYDIGKAKIGMMICYDWIYPETMRILSLLGADIICHPANLVLPYCPKVMPSRCFDNKVFAITANRCGKDVKNDSEKSFIGQSQILSPEGKIIKRSGPDEQAMEIVFINQNEARNKKMNSHNDLFADRRPEMYDILLKSREELESIKPVNATTSKTIDSYN